MNSDDLQDLFRLWKEPWGHEHQSQRHLLRFKLIAQCLGPALDARLVESSGPMSGAREFVVHSANLFRFSIIANIPWRRPVFSLPTLSSSLCPPHFVLRGAVPPLPLTPPRPIANFNPTCASPSS